ncbi:MFS transporter [Candidatus Micrarchaeota archaeon]|nr:MFS transporter [Candidatus Micrarchaeota archaeon]
MSNVSKRNSQMVMQSTMLWSLSEGVMGIFIIPFALALGAGNVDVGIIGAMPFLALILAQLPGAELVERWKSRRRVNIFCCILSRLALVPIILVPFYFQNIGIAILVAFLFVAYMMASMGSPAWASMTSDMAPKRTWGAFFGKRLAIIDMSVIASGILGALLLDQTGTGDMRAFSYVFSASLLIGMANILPVARLKEPRIRKHNHKLRDFLKVPKDLKKLIVFRSFFNFAYMFPGPFFTVFMLETLGMGYTEFVLYSIVGSASSMLWQKKWGSIADRLGDKPTLIASIIGVSFVPVLFSLATPETKWLLLPVQAFSGFIWAGFWVSAENLTLDYTEKEKRAVQIADFNMLTSVPMVFAPILGGMASQLNAGLLTGIPLVFGMATVMRVSSILLANSLRETRVKHKHETSDVYREVVAVNPVKGTLCQLHAATDCVKCLWNARLARKH